jgi:hypothetical protein
MKYRYDPHYPPHRWRETPKGGMVLHKTAGVWHARPFDRLGTTTIQVFTSEQAAWEYAETPSR